LSLASEENWSTIYSFLSIGNIKGVVIALFYSLNIIKLFDRKDMVVYLYIGVLLYSRKKLPLLFFV